MMFIRERIGKLLEYLRDMIYSDEEKAGGYGFLKAEKHFGDYAYTENLALKPFGDEEIWGGHHEYYCFAGDVVIPERFAGKCVVFELVTGREGEWDATNPQFSIYVNKKLVQGLDVNHREIVLSENAIPGEKYEIVLSAFTGDQNFHLRLDSRLKVLEREIEQYYYDINVPYQVAKLLPPDSRDYYNILTALNDSLNLLDLRVEYSEGFYASLKRAQDNIRTGFYEKYCGGDGPVTYCVGHTHIDCAWMWTMSVTRDKAVRSFSTALELMKAYPEYRFMSSQPLLYKFIKKQTPEKYEEIKQMAASGRWEPEGGMYVEADCNLSSGESFIRQILYGKRFFKEEFGADCEILWLPDVFGYSAALPQIMKKCGMKYFMTTKISWNELNKMPYDTFEWEGIDGSRVLTHFVPTRDYNAPAVDGGTATAHYTTYVGMLTPSHVMGGWQRYSQKYLNSEVMMTYGYGDGGGGPTKEMLETQRRLAKGISGCPKTRISSAKEFFHVLDEHVSGNKYLPCWTGELYLEYHRGTYTSMARNKRYNRKAEFAYGNLELYCIMDTFMNGSSYPAADIRSGWEVLLHNQFHDILPGSSIKEVYEDSKNEYEAILARADALEKNALNNVALNIRTDKGSLIVFNPNSFDISGLTVFDCGLSAPVVYDGEERLEVQRLSDGSFIFNAVDVPSKGYKTFRLEDAVDITYEKNSGSSLENCNLENSVPQGNCPDVSFSAAQDETAEDCLKTIISSDKTVIMKNKYYNVVFDEKGHMVSLFDKRACREVIKDGQYGNVIMTYEDRPHNFDAWDLNNYYEEKSWEADNVTGIEITENGPVVNTIKITRRYLESDIVQYISLYADNPGIDIRHEIDWRQKQIFVKLCFPADIHTSEATFEIQYGNVKRATHYNTSWDAARFEVCMHKWADVSEDNFGLSILNDCKYGISIHDGNIGVSLLKSAIYPNPEADREHHEFTIRLLPHEGSFKEAGTIQQAYLLNNPMQAVIKTNDGGYLPETCSFVKSDCENVIVEAVKQAEDSDDIIVRVYECYNRRSNVCLTFGGQIQSAFECNMLEETEDEPVTEDNMIFIKMMPFEIKTLKLKLKR